jgi:hypothetical protein
MGMCNFTYLDSLCYLQTTYMIQGSVSDGSSPCVTTHWGVVPTFVFMHKQPNTKFYAMGRLSKCAASACICVRTRKTVTCTSFVTLEFRGERRCQTLGFYVMGVPSKCESSVCICVRTRKMVTCKSFVIFEYRGERLIEPSSSWIPPNFLTG